MNESQMNPQNNNADEQLDRAIRAVLAEPAPCEARDRALALAAAWGAEPAVAPKAPARHARWTALLALAATLLLIAMPLSMYIPLQRPDAPSARDVARITDSSGNNVVIPVPSTEYSVPSVASHASDFQLPASDPGDELAFSPEALAAIERDVTQGSLRMVRHDAGYRSAAQQADAKPVDAEPAAKPITVVECPLEHTDVRAEISGFISRVHVTQTFRNPTSEKIEAVYVFPLPNEGAVDGMTMIIGDRKIVGQIKRRTEARTIYQQAVSSGQSAALLEQERPNIFTQSVGNIPPGETVKIEIQYVDVLKYDLGVYQFHFPMVVGPRYNPGNSTGSAAPRPAEIAAQVSPPEPDTDRVVDASWITPPVLKPGNRTGHDVSLAISLDAGVPIQNLDVSSHQTTTERQGNNRARIVLSSADSIPNKDFVLRYKVVGKKPEMALLAHTGDPTGDAQRLGEGYFLLMIQPQEDEQLKKSPPREIVFLVDVSGSMSGEPTAKVIETMQSMLKLCRPVDTVQVVTFAGNADKLFERPVSVTKENIAKALQFTNGITAGGGTEMLKGIKLAIDEPVDVERMRIVVMLTDGYIGNEAEIIEHVGKNCGDRVRFWALGIGSAPNMMLIDGVAKQGGGMGKQLGLNDDALALSQEVMNRIQRAQLADLRIDWGDLQVAETYPRKLPELWAGRPVMLYGRYAAADGVKTEIKIRGNAEGTPVEWPLAISLPKQEPSHDVLAKVWARQKIEDLMQQAFYKDSSPVVEAVTGLALQYQLMSQYTSFVAVDATKVETPTEQARPPRRMLVPVPLPAGTRWEGFFGPTGERGDGRAEFAGPQNLGDHDGVDDFDQVRVSEGSLFIELYNSGRPRVVGQELEFLKPGRYGEQGQAYMNAGGEIPDFMSSVLSTQAVVKSSPRIVGDDSTVKNGGTLHRHSKITGTVTLGDVVGFSAGNSVGSLATDNSVQNGTISGSGSLVKQGAGTLVLSGTANSYTGGTIINGGTLSSYGSPGQLSPTVPWFDPNDEQTRTIDDEVQVSPTQTGKIMLGVGVNSNAGLVGQIVIDEENFDWHRLPRASTPPQRPEANQGYFEILESPVGRVAGPWDIDNDTDGLKDPIWQQQEVGNALTMSVTPRIVIQEEENESLGVPPPSPGESTPKAKPVNPFEKLLTTAQEQTKAGQLDTARATCREVYLRAMAVAQSGRPTGGAEQAAFTWMQQLHAMQLARWSKELPALNQPLNLVLRDRTLAEALADVAQAAGCRITLLPESETDAVELVGRRSAHVEYLDLRHATVAQALDWILHAVRIDWRVDGNQIIAGSPRRDAGTSAWVYDVAALAIPLDEELQPATPPPSAVSRDATAEREKDQPANDKPLDDKQAAEQQAAQQRTHTQRIAVARQLGSEFAKGLRTSLHVEKSDELVRFAPGQILLVGDSVRHRAMIDLLTKLADPKAAVPTELQALHAKTAKRAAARREALATLSSRSEQIDVLRTLDAYGWPLLAAAAAGNVDDESLTRLTVAWHDPEMKPIADGDALVVALHSLWQLKAAARALPTSDELAALVKQANEQVGTAAHEAIDRLTAKPEDLRPYWTVFYAALVTEDIAERKAALAALDAAVSKHPELAASRRLLTLLVGQPAAEDVAAFTASLRQGPVGADATVLSALAARRTGGDAWRTFQSETIELLGKQPLPGEVLLLVNRLGELHCPLSE